MRSDIAAWQRRRFSGSASALAGLRLGLHYGGFRAAVIYRVSHEIQCRRIPAVPSLLSGLNMALHGVDIAPSVPIGTGLYLPHPVGIVIHARGVGSDVEVQSCVTIGQKDGTGFPRIGDGVVIACGARVLGAITLGDASIVGANAVVLRDVAAADTVVGVPARSIGCAATDD